MFNWFLILQSRIVAKWQLLIEVNIYLQSKNQNENSWNWKLDGIYIYWISITIPKWKQKTPLITFCSLFVSKKVDLMGNSSSFSRTIKLHSSVSNGLNFHVLNRKSFLLFSFLTCIFSFTINFIKIKVEFSKYSTNRFYSINCKYPFWFVFNFKRIISFSCTFSTNFSHNIQY